MTEETNLEEDFISEAEDAPTDLEGTVIDSRYEVIRRIGSGGMGVVYLAKQRGIGREVVVKVMRTSLSDESEGRARFEREAQGLSKLQHQNVVTIFDFGRDGDLFFIVMEYVEGESLARFLRRRDHLNFAAFGPIAVQILSAIAEAHRAGIIHRDLKPGNVMLCKRQGHSNFVKVLDFGLAKLMNSKNDVTKKTDLVGSASFMAPEQILGDRAADQRVDVYSLGVLFYFMLSGKKPFEADDDLTILYHQVHTKAPSLAEALPPKHDVPPEVIRLIDRCLRKAPAERPRDAGEIIELLRDGVESSSVFSTPWSSLGDHTPFPRPRPTASMSPESDSAKYEMPAAAVPAPKSNKLIPVLIVAVLLLLAGLGYMFLRDQPGSASVAVVEVGTPAVSEEEEPKQGDRSGIARGLRVAGLAALESGNYEEAVKSFTKALQLGGAGDDVGELLQIARTLVDNSAPKESNTKAEPAEAPKQPAERPVAVTRPAAAARPNVRPAVSSAAPKQTEQKERVEMGMLLIASTPNGVVFKLNDDDGGVTPIRVSVPVGSHTVTYFQNGSPVATRRVNVREGTLAILDVDLRPPEPEPAVAARAESEAKPDPIPTPSPAPVEPPPVNETVASAVTRAPVDPPASAMGELMIESPNVYGEVWVNGKQVGFPPTVVRNIPVGTANVEIKIDGKTRRTQRVRVTEQKRTTVRM